MAALFFLAFAYFAVGQASVVRNGAQTAADAAALAAAREQRDAVSDTFLAALKSGDDAALQHLLANLTDNGLGCTAAAGYAADNRAELLQCDPVNDPVGYRVEVRSLGTVGRSVVRGTENIHATAHAAAVVEPRCTFDEMNGPVADFVCDSGPLDIDPTGTGFTLDLSDFYAVHLSD